MKCFLNKFLGAGAPLGLTKLVTVHQKVSKSNNLFSLVFTSILILVTCYMLLVTKYLLSVTCYLTLVTGTCYLVFSPAICYLFLVTPDTSYLLLASRYMFSNNLYRLPLTIYLLPDTCYLMLATQTCYPQFFSGHLSPEMLYWILSR